MENLSTNNCEKEIQKLDRKYDDVNIDEINKDIPHVRRMRVQYEHPEKDGFPSRHELTMVIIFKNKCQYDYIGRPCSFRSDLFDDIKGEVWSAIGCHEDDSEPCENPSDIYIIDDGEITSRSEFQFADVDLRHWIYMYVN